MKYVFIEKYQAEFNIKAMCRVLRVTRSGWYVWRCRRHQANSRQQFRLVCDDVGWSMSSRMTATLACNALHMALWRRKRPQNIIVHTDRGGQYCSADYQAMLKSHNLRGSMSAKGCCYDNACAESFFHSLKVECIHGEHFASREIMRTAVFNYIECDYNRWRRHSACGGLSPEQFENQNLA